MKNNNKNDLLQIYRTMKTSRYFEERMEKAYLEGKQPIFNIGAGPVPGEMHLSNGQEPAAAAMIVHLTKDDTVTATHRPHHQAIAKGVDLKKMTAEIFGKKTGLGKGKGGHMHLFDPTVKFSCGGIVGAGIPHAVGAALANKKKGEDWVAVAFIGEGAANSGAFHESLNLAALWNLPFILVVEDNSWGISVAKKNSTSVPSNDIRAKAYGIKGYLVKDNDPVEMYKVSKEAVDRARNGGGPSIIEIETYRFLGHFQGDPELYRNKEEVPTLRGKDPIERLKNHLLKENLATPAEISALENKVYEVVDDAYEFAIHSEYPEPNEALEDVFC
ncbi:thiamine pyrophosphate-dependent dehydrogenase E1 component subunit alpha [Maribacter polysiphoniae]|uniref:Pyruvate dehydrogenase E1 component alpha subunit n=1 Tax=Maribacter polysiphoniae TaxID=429344 RepID=A0A316E086_9FLAO|nr:thiamine pyrophosphate-dependent dehydrogenase E1 component subunit alpha [Maribacter polysiphoniae]MBD1259760.1 thiamine pyrophosphate-dependent dehydrogenase E1 component subunit alpha [Maribacter polysiphoniae]PWK23098.1 pyruvate dehydrogenase E1 component alpha subunit [Maribacter polysiphoniae]